MHRFILASLVTTFAIQVVGYGCGYGKVGCEIIDIAHTACETFPIRYMDEHGNERVEHVPVEELKAAAKASKLKREEGEDKGAQ